MQITVCHLLKTHASMYEGRSINKLQNGAIPSVLKIGKIRNIRFVGNLILNIHTTFLDDDVIIVTRGTILVYRRHTVYTRI